MDELLNEKFLTVIGTILVAMIGGWVTLIAAKKKAVPELQAAINEAAQKLIDQLQEERKELRHAIKNLEGKVDALSVHVGRLEAVIVELGGTPPPRPVLTRRSDSNS